MPTIDETLMNNFESDKTLENIPTASYTAPVITSESLREVRPYNIPEKEIRSTTGDLALANVSAIGSIKTDANYTPPPIDPIKEQKKTFLQKILPDFSRQASDVQAIQQDPELLKKKERATAISYELDELDKSFQEEVKQIKTASGGTVSGMRDKIALAQDKYENRRANISLAYKIAAGDYQGAQVLAEQKIAALKDGNALNLQTYKLLVDEISDDLTESEKLQVQANINAKQKKSDEITAAYSDTLKALQSSGQNVPAAVYNAVDAASRSENASPASIYAAAGQYAIKKATGGGIDNSETVDTYAQLLADGKISLANVPQSIRNQVVAASGGIINKPLSDTAIKDIQQSQSAVANLNALKNIVETNLQFVGPISGLARFNPYSQARQVQAEIDRVRQQVGKTLEGGVLRKEDEEKYKKILATLADTPETALYKIDSLIGSLERDIELYKTLQKDTGRFVPGSSSKPEDLRTKYNY